MFASEEGAHELLMNNDLPGALMDARCAPPWIGGNAFVGCVAYISGAQLPYGKILDHVTPNLSDLLFKLAVLTPLAYDRQLDVIANAAATAEYLRDHIPTDSARECVTTSRVYRALILQAPAHTEKSSLKIRTAVVLIYDKLVVLSRGSQITDLSIVVSRQLETSCHKE